MDKTNDISLKELLKIFSEYKSELFLNKKLIIFSVLFFCGFSLIFSTLIKSKYKADITFVVQTYKTLEILLHLLDLILEVQEVLLVKKMLLNCLNPEE